jgi:hypothetical protein
MVTNRSVSESTVSSLVSSSLLSFSLPVLPLALLAKATQGATDYSLMPKYRGKSRNNYYWNLTNVLQP